MAGNRDLLAPAWVTTAGLGFLTLNSGLAIYRADGDPGSILFVVGSYARLEGTHRDSRHMDREDRRPSFLTKVGFGVLTCNSALAVYQSHNDPGSVAFVAGAYGAIVLLFHLLRKLDNSADREARRKILAAVWALTTLLTAMFASKVAPLMPQFVAVQVWLTAAATAVGGFLAFFADL